MAVAFAKCALIRWVVLIVNVIHSIWIPEKGLHIWAESSGLRSNRKAKGEEHPFAAGHTELYEFLGKIKNKAKSNRGLLTLELPTDSRGVLPSAELKAREVNGKYDTSAWSMPSLEFSGGNVMEFFLSLPHQPPGDVIYGSSTRYWLDAARYSLELLVKESFVPCIAREEPAGEYRIIWNAHLGGEDEPRMSQLINSLPGIAGSYNSGTMNPEELLSSFINHNINSFIQGSCSKDADLVEHILNSDPAKERIYQGMREWLGSLKSAASTPLRTCFRLDPPKGIEEIKKGEKDSWGLSFHLQARNDESLLIPAGAVWRSGAVLNFLGSKFENPQERLLGDLGMASRIYLPIEGALQANRPTHVELKTDDVRRFLSGDAVHLEQSGFGIILPKEWKESRVKLDLFVKKQGSVGYFTLGSVMEFDWQAAIGDEKVDLMEFENIAALKTPLIEFRGRWTYLNQEDMSRIMWLMKHKNTIDSYEAVRMMLSEDTNLFNLHGGKEISEFVNVLKGKEKIKMLGQPDGINGKLRPYQLRGVSWISFMSKYGIGACLADDMGLGKTIQIIAMLMQSKPELPALVVSPMSIVGNWEREIRKFAPGMKVMVHHGSDRRSGRKFTEDIKKSDVVITTYGLLSRDKEISSAKWSYLIADEAQNIKNPLTKQAQAIKKLNSRCRIALTGTPVENRLTDLWSIMDFLNHGYLKSQDDFISNYSMPIEKYNDTKTSERLRAIIKPFVLRRLKTDKSIISDLPEKIENDLYINLTKEQATLYQAVVKDMLLKIESAEGINRSGLIFSALTKFKQICDHPALFMHDKSRIEGRSGKLERLVEMLEEAIAEGDKSLIFTQYAEMGSLLQKHIKKELDIEVLFLHGGTAKAQRDSMVEDFQTSPYIRVFVLSLKAGGLGLNLTAANRVFHYDRWWNPAVENQATDRAFRIGQKKNVQVHKFISTGTLEERIAKMLEKKKALSEGVIGSGESWITKLSTAELRNLFELSSDGEE